MVRPLGAGEFGLWQEENNRLLFYVLGIDNQGLHKVKVSWYEKIKNTFTKGGGKVVAIRKQYY